MRTALIFFLLASPALAQGGAAAKAILSACGPADVKFDVNLNQTEPLVEPASGKAFVYVIEDRGQGVAFGRGITVRVGLDGAWVGANKENSYLSFSVLPGEHHICSNWQSSLKGYAAYHSLTSFTAEADKIYYFRARFWVADREPRLDLDEVNNDEGRYLVSAFALAVSHPKR